MKCYNRFDNGIYLLTCLEEDGHKGDHKDDRGETWTSEEGFFDQFGEKRRSKSECHPPLKPRVILVPKPVVYHTATVTEESIRASVKKPGDVVSAEALVGCFNCRAGRHEACVFDAKRCPCRAREHKPAYDGYTTRTLKEPA